MPQVKRHNSKLVDFDYFVWKWAENDEKGKPNDVFASLMRGKLHPALQPFQSGRYGDLFNQFSGACFKDGGTFYQEQIKDKATGFTIAIHIIGKHSNPNSVIGKLLQNIELEACSVLDGQMTRYSLPKQYCFSFETVSPVYDFEYDELPALIGSINNRDNAFGILEDARGHYVQAYEGESRYSLEWAEWRDWQERTWLQRDHFRVGLKQSSKGTIRLGSQTSYRNVRINCNEAISFADVLTCFQAFYRHEPKPSQYVWRNIN